jgi:hypothetical protein
LATVAFVGWLVTGGSEGSPQVKRSLYLERAKRCFNWGEFDMAEIEYRNVLRIDPMQPLAIRRLGVIDQDQGKGGWALSFLLKDDRIGAGQSAYPVDVGARLAFGASGQTGPGPGHVYIGQATQKWRSGPHSV